MIQTTVKVDGMMCGMCEAHINDAVRRVLPIKKVTSSHTKGETILLTEDFPDEDTLRRAIDNIGYSVAAITSVPCKKRRLFSLI